MSLTYSIADQIDRLTITLLKHWHLEEQIAETSEKVKQGQTELESELADMFTRSVSLNQYRNKVIDSINEFFNDPGKREDRSK